MQENPSKITLDRICADQIALAPYSQTDHFCMVYQNEDTPFGKVGRWYALNLENGQSEPTRIKPSPCFWGSSLASSKDQFFYYQDHYPKRAFYQYDPAQNSIQEIGSIDQSLGSFQVDGDWIVYLTEPEAGVFDQPEAFHFLNWKNQTKHTLTSAQAYSGRPPATRHQNWHFKQGKLFFVCRHENWKDDKGQSLKDYLVCYDEKLHQLFGLVRFPADVSVQQMLFKEGNLWILGARDTQRILYFIRLEGTAQPAVLEEILVVEHDSYHQLIDIKLVEQGLFWLKKEMHSLLENSSSLWMFSFEKKETILLVRLSDFRALDLRFQVVGDYLYYQDELWKYFYCTPLEVPLTKEKIEEKR